jgi:catalase
VAGRVIGIVTDTGSDLDAVIEARDVVHGGSMTPLIIAPVGGVLSAEAASVTVQRTYHTARSIEFDAVLVAGDLSGTPDPRILQLLGEAYRHCKALGGWDGAQAVLSAAGIPADAPGLVLAGAPTDIVGGITDLLATHRVWERVTVS